MKRKINIAGIEPPEKTCSDPNCPFHGNLALRGAVLEGVVVKAKASQMAVIRHDYLRYVSKYRRYERRKRLIHAHLPPCIDVKEKEKVVIAECRPIAKSVAFCVVGSKGKA